MGINTLGSLRGRDLPRFSAMTTNELNLSACVCVYYYSTYYQAVRGGGGGGGGGHVLRETTSRGQCERVCPSRTNERGDEGYCVKGGGEEVGEHKRERAGRVRLYYSLGY